MKMNRKEFMLGAGALALSSSVFADEKPYLKAGFLTDTHLAPNRAKNSERTRLAFETFRAKGVDVIGHCGDLADFHYTDMYAFYRSCIETTYPDKSARPKLLYVYAGHDLIDPEKVKAKAPRDARYLSEDVGYGDMRDRLGIEHWYFHKAVIRGVPFLVFPQHLENAGNFDRVEKMLAETCAEHPDGPIVAMAHLAPAATVYESARWGYWRYRQILEKHPRVISFSGHTHNSLRNPRSFWQGAFSAVDVGCLDVWYGEWPNGRDGFPPSYKTGYGVVVAEFYRDRVAIRRYDVRDGSEVGTDDPWIVRQPYVPVAPAAPMARADVPAFPAGTALSLRQTKEGVEVSFPPVPNDERLRGYRVTGDLQAGGVWHTRIDGGVYSDFYLRPADRTAKRSFVINAGRFQKEVPYRMSITPVAHDGTEGFPISSTIVVKL